MKMGDFCKNFDINSDTVRYYIDEGLLAPRKRNNRYEFTDNDLRDMESINKYKDLNFSIKQIAQIMSYSRISIDEKSIYASFIMGFYKKKETELLEEKKHI
ncbi:MerR family transcriptional regulator [Geotoga petraea]|nr:MerR family transcriptional regulator [Geotoga petraea]